MKQIDVGRIIIDQKAIDIVPGALARRLGILPLAIHNDTVQVAVRDPDDISAIEHVERISGLRTEMIMPKDRDIFEKALRRYYPDLSSAGAANTATGLFERLLSRAIQLRASDIHIHPSRDEGTIRMRIDGRIRTDRRIAHEPLKELVSVIKIMAGLDIAEKRIPLDGNIRMKLSGDDISLRVATIPSLYGEHLTLRILTQGTDDSLESMENLGMDSAHLKIFLRALDEPNGIILLSGPTGSGKTTTLYAALRHLRKNGDHHIVSIEDPVESPIEGVTQIKIDADDGRVTFNRALRSVLRHDPDIMMIGEIRDAETGDIAVKASLTGHLVLSTLHTNNAAGVLTRLVNLGVAPFLVASTMKLSIAQRLVRMPCRHCVKQRPATADERDFFGWDAASPANVPEPVGCQFCGGSGYSGRTGIYEMIAVDETIRRMILGGEDEFKFADYAFGQLGMPDLKRDGASKILRGLTTVEEVRDVI